MTVLAGHFDPRCELCGEPIPDDGSPFCYGRDEERLDGIEQCAERYIAVRTLLARLLLTSQQPTLRLESSNSEPNSIYPHVYAVRTADGQSAAFSR